MRRRANSPAPPALPPDTHVEIVGKPFELGGLRVEAVRVTYKGAGRFLVKDAIRATDANGKVIRSEEHWQRIYADRANTPSELKVNWLVTARPGPGYPGGVSCLGRYVRGWCGRWGSLELGWDDRGLVLRLCT